MKNSKIKECCSFINNTLLNINTINIDEIHSKLLSLKSDDNYIALILNITAMYFSKDKKMSLQPYYVSFDLAKRSFDLVDVSEKQFIDLYKMLNHLDNHVLIARLADSIWSAKKIKDIRSALKQAIDSYLIVLTDAHLFKIKDKYKFYNTYTTYIKRLFQLSKIYDQIKNTNIRQIIFDTLDIFIEKRIQKEDQEKLHLLYPLLELSSMNPNENIKIKGLLYKLLEIKITDLSINNNISRLISLCKKYSKNITETNILYRKEAEFYVKLSEVDYTNRKLNIFKCFWLEKAIEIYRSRNLDKIRFDEIHKMLLIAQKESTKENRASFSEKVDVRDLIESINDMFSEKASSLEILAKLSNLPCNPIIPEEKEKMPFSALFSSVYTDVNGKVIAKDGNSKEKNDHNMQIHNISSLYIPFFVNSTILPALNQINKKHPIDVDGIYCLVENNPLIPPGKKAFFIRGIEAGFYNDWILCISMLVPIMESIIRNQLNNIGIITTTYAPGNQKDKHSLESLLIEAKKNDLINDGNHLYLEALLFNSIGFNLRHNLAHGLSDYNSLNNNYGSIYFWWFSLYLLFKGLK